MKEKVKIYYANGAKGEIFRIARIVNNYSLKEMGTILGASESYICQVEKGDKWIAESIESKYLEYFKIKKEDFERAVLKIIKEMLKDGNEVVIWYIVIKLLMKSHKES